MGAGVRAALSVPLVSAVRTSRSMSAGPNALVICGPSGVGKGTLIDMLKQEYPLAFGFSVSHTTRQPRPGEKNGVHYHFVSVEKMEADIKAGKFLEHANVHGNFYGTSIAAVESVRKTGKICILDIDVQGCRQCRKAKLPGTYVFVSPPSFEELEKRLRGRGTETEDKIAKRLANAKGEMDARTEAGLFDKQVRLHPYRAGSDGWPCGRPHLPGACAAWVPGLLCAARNAQPRPVSVASACPVVCAGCEQQSARSLCRAQGNPRRRPQGRRAACCGRCGDGVPACRGCRCCGNWRLPLFAPVNALVGRRGCGGASGCRDGSRKGSLAGGWFALSS